MSNRHEERKALKRADEIARSRGLKPTPLRREVRRSHLCERICEPEYMAHRCGK